MNFGSMFLLGISWLFEQKVLQNGYLSTSCFSKDGKKITLAPLAPSQLHKKQPQKNLEQSDLFLTFSEPLSNTSYHDFQSFKEWILTIKDGSESLVVNHPLDLSLHKK